MNFDRRTFLAASAASTAVPFNLVAQPSENLRPEDFGARGNGATNDTAAFAALSLELNKRGGGTVWLKEGSTYLVGAQRRGGSYGWTPQPILELTNLSNAINIVGNGARLKCSHGLRFGTFDFQTGNPLHRSMSNTEVAELASPYRALIYIHHCRGPVAIKDLELDGSIEQLFIGGKFGDSGWQIPATGLLLEANSGPELVDNLLSHHHGQDGAMIIGDDRRSARSHFRRLITRYNGRQGLSITGGRGYEFVDCEFSHTGRSAVRSDPAAGVDIEAEVGTVRDVSFARCKFIDNSGVGLLAESGDSADARFADCTFVGTTNWSAWPRRPGVRFDRCTFAGSVVNAFPSEDPALATKFAECRFTDDSTLSPTGQLFFGPGPIVNLGKSENVLFTACRFELDDRGELPWSWRAVYQDCMMRQSSEKTAQTKGKYIGRTVIDGPVDLYGSIILGTVILNGKQLPVGPVGADVRPW